jgi:hypothetical protein
MKSESVPAEPVVSRAHTSRTNGMTYLLRVLCSFSVFCAQFVAPTFAYSESPKAVAPAPSDIRAALTAVPWTWEHPKLPKVLVRFAPDGIVRSDRAWSGRWSITGLRTAEIEMSGQNEWAGRKAHLTFARDLRSFEAVHWDRATTVKGFPAPNETAPAKAAR